MSVPQFTQTGFLGVPKRSHFDLSHYNLISCNMGKLIPVFTGEILPNDTWKIRNAVISRFQPIIAPVLSRIDVKFYWFFTPNRLLYSDWEKFIAPNIQQSISVGPSEINVNSSYVPPFVSSETIWDFFDYYSDSVFEEEAGYSKTDCRKFMDYLGIPIERILDGNYTTEDVISLLPFMAYQRIWYDYFRDENLDDATEIPTSGGEYRVTSESSFKVLSYLFAPHVKAWDKDYFTSALPFAQKGPQVVIPIGQTADVNGVVSSKELGPSPIVIKDYASLTDQDLQSGNYYGRAQYRDENNVLHDLVGKIEVYSRIVGDVLQTSRVIRDENGVAREILGSATNVTYYPQNSESYANTLKADLTSATATTIDQFRTLFQLQKFFERAASVGTRYVELVKGFWGITPSDARLQRAEYIAGCKIPVVSNEVFSNAETQVDGVTTPLGSYAGKANAIGSDAPFTHFFEEHGILQCLMVVIPKTTYFQGISRMFTQRYDYTKYFWPQFAHLGEQEVKNSEIYFEGSPKDEDGTFGYQSRYVEYKFMPDEIHGDFRTSLDYWHLARKFDDLPRLNAEFIHAVPSKRIFAVEDQGEDSVMCQIEFDMSALRAMPEFAVSLNA